jgi:hypothetical protein
MYDVSLYSITKCSIGGVVNDHAEKYECDIILWITIDPGMYVAVWVILLASVLSFHVDIYLHMSVYIYKSLLKYCSCNLCNWFKLTLRKLHSFELSRNGIAIKHNLAM